MTEAEEIKPKNPVGAPSKYRKKYCKQIIKFMEKGSSAVQFAAEIGVSKQTLNNWTEDFREFFDAYHLAQTKCEAHWEKVVADRTINKSLGSDYVLNFYMANRFGWHSKNKVGLEGDPLRVGVGYGQKTPPPTGGGDEQPQVIITLPSNGREQQ